ncbi:MAG: 1-deoxy-D-xylulose-5-phosphate synthase [Candidatus Marinimicrobia bacterium]|nr:1-deoxy-D-xylulose-5-phosphate synthase [Candidatus Neomarinimicrobiota bacterium]
MVKLTESKILNTINSPDDLKKLSLEELNVLSVELINYIKDTVKQVGGHYSSPLGVVDLTLALHYVYNAPDDKIVWDVGHQAYAHKIITGRREEFKTLRKKDGISGFLKINESEYDAFGAGHASTSISAALGMAHARDQMQKQNQVLAIIGDGALTGGLAYEGINNLGYHRTQLTIVLNDNSMSISKSVGALSKYLNRVVTNPTYNKLRNDIWDMSGKMPMSDYLRKFLKKTEGGIKGLLTPGILFEELGLRYIGPVDGHDMNQMINTFSAVKKMNTPVLVHVYTKKGKGSNDAEIDSEKYYSVSEKTKSVVTSGTPFSKVIGESMKKIVKNDDSVRCVTAAMEIGTGLSTFVEQFPDKCIDVGIAEEHAVTYAAGLAANGLKPIVYIYSTFMQRAFDCIFHDVLLQDLPVIFCMDRAGLVGPDGPTHHGVFDISMLNILPNIIIAAPKDGDEFLDLLFTATKINKPFAIRYPKANTNDFDINREPALLNIGTWEYLIERDNAEIAILATGSMVSMVLESKEYVQEQIGVDFNLINCRFIKPLDVDILNDISKKEITHIVTIEEGSIIGGLGSMINDYFNNTAINVKTMGIPDEYIEHGSRGELLKEIGLDGQGLVDTIKAMYNEK